VADYRLFNEVRDVFVVVVIKVGHRSTVYRK
jgi:mRNA-degrading endonuclease RelE of RelBE toxin-antitoxin system